MNVNNISKLLLHKETITDPSSSPLINLDAPNNHSITAPTLPPGILRLRTDTSMSQLGHSGNDKAKYEMKYRKNLKEDFDKLVVALPNLPKRGYLSRHSIINHTIAYIGACLRYRCMAACELRLTMLESEAFCLELNKWRTRAGLPEVMQSTRSNDFFAVLDGKLDSSSTVLDDNEGSSKN